MTFLDWQSFRLLWKSSNFLHLSSKKQRRGCLNEMNAIFPQSCCGAAYWHWQIFWLTVAVLPHFNKLLTNMLKSLLGYWLGCRIGLPSIFEAIYIFLSLPISEACNLSPLKRTATLYRSHETWARILVITILQHGAKSIDLFGLLNAFASVQQFSYQFHGLVLASTL